MSPNRRLFVYVITETKIHFSKISFVKFTYSKNVKTLRNKVKNQNMNRAWIITDRLEIVETARKANYKIILLANGREKTWKISPFSYPDFICSSPKEIQNFLNLLRNARA